MKAPPDSGRKRHMLCAQHKRDGDSGAQ